MLPEYVHVLQKYHFTMQCVRYDAYENFIEALHVTPTYDVITVEVKASFIKRHT